jgi:FKBP-type peptidyl-prolyl cis-trans isomerase
MDACMNKLFAFMSVFVLVFIFPPTLFAEGEFIVTKSGLKYQELEIGTGATAEIGKIAVVHLIGWLDDNGQKGKEFISSHDRGKPVSFKLGTEKVMQGWNVGVSGMKVGGKRRLMIPSELGYGTKGVDDVVPPNADLIFEVELLDVK